MPVNREDCLALLERGARHYGEVWIISGRPYVQEAALRIAELCIRCKRPLSDVISVEWALSVARRLDTLEEQLAEISLRAGIKEEYYG